MPHAAHYRRCSEESGSISKPCCMSKLKCKFTSCVAGSKVSHALMTPTTLVLGGDAETTGLMLSSYGQHNKAFVIHSVHASGVTNQTYWHLTGSAAPAVVPYVLCITRQLHEHISKQRCLTALSHVCLSRLYALYQSGTIGGCDDRISAIGRRPSLYPVCDLSVRSVRT
jgi:hypothetical protein